VRRDLAGYPLDVSAETVDDRARRSDALAWSVRAGLVGYAVVHLLLAFIALRLVLAGGGGQATGQGALALLAGDGVGRWTLAAIAVGFWALVLWQVVAAAVGYQDREGRSRHLMRFGAACRVVTYGYLGYACAGFALAGRSAAKGSPETTTAHLLSLSYGPWLVAAVGLVTAGIGAGLAVFGWRAGFVGQLDEEARSSDRRVPIVLVGRFGYLAKALAMVVIGGLLVWAAWSHDPHKSGGLDESLYELLGHTLGTVAVLVVGAGIGSFGVYLLARARHLDRSGITS
jgi:hypothetical protein